MVSNVKVQPNCLERFDSQGYLNIFGTTFPSRWLNLYIDKVDCNAMHVSLMYLTFKEFRLLYIQGFRLRTVVCKRGTKSKYLV